MRWRASMYLVPILALAACPGVTSEELAISWVFVNTSAATVSFSGSVTDDFVQATVASGQTGQRSSSVDLPEGSVTANVHVTGIPVEAIEAATAQVQGNAMTVTATWNGTALSVTIGAGCSSATASQAASPLGASACTALTSWTLDGITGATSVNWQYQHESGSGTLTFSVPPKVTEGETYPVSATFTASVTADSTRRGLNTVIQALIRDETFPGNLQVLNQTTFGPISPSASGSVTVTGSWTIPKNNIHYQNRTTLPLVARGGNVIGDTTRRVATYSKVP
jgi:hypothetical protein